MDKKQAEKRIAKLRQEINHHRYLYHVLDKQEISDAALDSLKHELKQLEDKFPDLITADSPTQRIAGQVLPQFSKIRHKQRMLSLEDAFSQEELLDWQKKILRFLGRDSASQPDFSFMAEPKIDGLAVSLEYKNGIFWRGSTRGDGLVGEDVSQNLKTIEAIPLRLAGGKKRPLLVEVRGEVYMAKKDFARVNQEQEKNNLSHYANPRNIAAGSIRQLDPKITASRKLRFMAYDLVTDLGQTTHQQEHQLLRELGFAADMGKHCQDLTAVQSYFVKTFKARKDLVYEIDGLVVQVNDNALMKDLAVVGKTPRGAIALKFPAKQAATMVADIKVQVGRTGALTPVAHLQPVNLAGVRISRATLHNADEIKRLDVRKGDTVILERAGDVIPDVIKVLKRLRPGQSQPFVMPIKCPICASKIEARLVAGKDNKGVIHFCPNKLCSAQNKRRFYHFVSKKGFNIVGLGPKIMDELLKADLLSDFADIFTLAKGDLLNLPLFAEKKADKLLEAVAKSKTISLPRLLYALGILHIGEENAIIIADKLSQDLNKHGLPINLAKVAKAGQQVSLAGWQGLEAVGPVMGQSLLAWFSNKANQGLLGRLDKAGVRLQAGANKVSSRLQGQIFVFTGELAFLAREQAQARVRSLGGQVSSSVSKNTDYLVVGENPGGKFTTAKELGAKIIREEEFREKIK